MSGSSSGERREWILPNRESASVLLLAPSRSSNASTQAQKLLTTVSEAKESVLVVSYPTMGSTWLDWWADDGHEFAANVKFVEVADELSHENSDHAVRNVELEDLDGLESQILKFFENCAETNTQPVLFFDSLSALADQAGVPAAHDVLSRISEASNEIGARSYFHIARSQRGLINDLSEYVDLTAEAVSDENKWIVS